MHSICMFLFYVTIISICVAFVASNVVIVPSAIFGVMKLFGLASHLALYTPNFCTVCTQRALWHTLSPLLRPTIPTRCFHGLNSPCNGEVFSRSTLLKLGFKYIWYDEVWTIPTSSMTYTRSQKPHSYGGW